MGAAVHSTGALTTLAAMPFPEEADDESAPVPPLPPEDRLWRHPSERAASARAVVTHRRRRTPSLLVGAGLALVVTVGLATLIAVRGDDATSRLAAGVSPTGAVVPVEVAASLAPALVEVTAERPGGRETTTGLIVRSDGHLATTADALRGAVSITVRLHDGMTYNARVVGTDDADDIAVLDIGATGLAAAELAGETPTLSDPVFVLGRSSDDDRPWASVAWIDGTDQRFVTADGSVHVGMLRAVLASSPVSGGVVCDHDGTVLGMLTARTRRALTATEPTSTLVTGARNVSFANPSGWIARVTDEIIDSGSFHRGWIGIVADDASAGAPAGAVVQSVIDGSPAQRSGLRAGDLVTEVAGSPVRSADDLALVARSLRPGSTVAVVWWRDGEAVRGETVVSERT